MTGDCKGPQKRDYDWSQRGWWTTDGQLLWPVDLGQKIIVNILLTQIYMIHEEEDLELFFFSL